MSINTAAAAALYGLRPATFNRTMQRLRAKGQDFRLPKSEWFDARTPLWDEAALTVWLANRKEEAVSETRSGQPGGWREGPSADRDYVGIEAIPALFEAAVPHIRAEALREAARAMDLAATGDPVSWLLDRAARIESEAGKQ